MATKKRKATGLKAKLKKQGLVMPHGYEVAKRKPRKKAKKAKKR